MYPTKRTYRKQQKLGITERLRPLREFTLARTAKRSHQISTSYRLLKQLPIRLLITPRLKPSSIIRSRNAFRASGPQSLTNVEPIALALAGLGSVPTEIMALAGKGDNRLTGCTMLTELGGKELGQTWHVRDSRFSPKRYISNSRQAV